MGIALSRLLWEDGWGLSILRGSAVTVVVGMLGMSLGMMLGLLLAAVKWARIPVASQSGRCVYGHCTERAGAAGGVL
jgi:octopine/nopaline transport system permease protein